MLLGARPHRLGANRRRNSDVAPAASARRLGSLQRLGRDDPPNGEIAFIVLPLIAPVAWQLGIDMVWLTVLLAVNLQTSFMHPPFGIALYNLRSVSPPSIPTSQIYWGAVPFLALQILMVALLIVVPQIVIEVAAPKIDVNQIQILLPSPTE